MLFHQILICFVKIHVKKDTDVSQNMAQRVYLQAMISAQIVNITNETDSVRRYFLQVPSALSQGFVPGQFVVITFSELPENANTRSYSIASSPSENGILELCIVKKEGGKATDVLWNKKVGDTLELSEPQGRFVLPDTGFSDLVFICTGTGIAPFRSMIQQLFKNTVTANVYLIFGCRYEKDILYKQEMEELMQQHSQFHYIPVLSRQEDWNGHRGYVHAVYEELFAGKSDIYFMVCGWSEMCSEARNRLKTMGFNRRQYLFEDYG